LQLNSIERLNLAIAAGAVAVGYATEGPAFATSLALGAGIEGVNFRALRSGTQRLFAGDLSVGHAWVAGFALRFVVLAGAIALSLRAGAQPVGLLLGLSTIVPAVIVGAWRARPPIGNPEPGPLPDDPSWDAWNPWLARERDPAEREER
jgi:ATP synthase I subunit